MPNADGIERSYVFGMPDLTAMSTTAANDWMSAAYPGLVLTLPKRVTGNGRRQGPSHLRALTPASLRSRS